jgi:hypothetical protein
MAMSMKIAPTIAQVFDEMKKGRITFGDLIEVGGEDLNLSDFRKVEKARRVEKTWSLMAKLGVKYADLEQAAGPTPERSGCGPRGEGVFSEVIENKGLFDHKPLKAKSLKNKEKAVLHSVDPSEPDPAPAGRWKRKRRLTPKGAAA